MHLMMSAAAIAWMFEHAEFYILPIVCSYWITRITNCQAGAAHQATPIPQDAALMKATLDWRGLLFVGLAALCPVIPVQGVRSIASIPGCGQLLVQASTYSRWPASTPLVWSSPCRSWPVLIKTFRLFECCNRLLWPVWKRSIFLPQLPKRSAAASIESWRVAH